MNALAGSTRAMPSPVGGRHGSCVCESQTRSGSSDEPLVKLGTSTRG